MASAKSAMAMDRSSRCLDWFSTALMRPLTWDSSESRKLFLALNHYTGGTL